jgi:hypothetical protein
MATKKKPKKKTMKSKKPASKRVTPKKRKTPKKLVKKNASPKKAAAKTRSVGKKTISRKTVLPPKKRTSPRSRSRDGAVFSRQGRGSLSGEQAGDLQGLSNVEAADSESVDELLEEGNAFEADVISGVQAADDADEQEVHTHEVPEDDVPGEYLDED